MANFTINDKDYKEEIRKLATTDKGHADVFNAVLEPILNNAAFAKRLVDVILRSEIVSVPQVRWSNTAPYTQTVNVPGITLKDEPMIIGYIEPGTDSEIAEAESIACAYLDGGDTGDGTISIYCNYKKPAVNFKIKVIGIGL